MERQHLPAAVVRVMDAVDRRLAQPLRLDDLARAAGLSRFHFHRVFRRTCGESPARFVERLRLERVALLLLASDTPITELAWEVGFRNPETLARRFRTHFGVTARAYRRRQLELWSRLGLHPGRDPGGPGSAVAVREMPSLLIGFSRTLGDADDEPPQPLPGDPPVRVRRTLDWPGITPPARVRVDRGVVQPRPGNGFLPGRLAPGPYATVELQPGPVPNRAYQRLFVWSLEGDLRLAPGAVIELLHGDRTLVCQPLRERIGGHE